MKRLALQVMVCLLAVCMLATTAIAEALPTDVDYTVKDKLQKQMEAGSGFAGTLTIESIATEGSEGQAITTTKPIVIDCTYINVAADATTKNSAEKRLNFSLVDDGEVISTAEVSLRDGMVYAKTPLLGEGWFALDLTGGAAAQAEGTQGTDTLNQKAAGLLATSALPGLATFAAKIMPGVHLGSNAQLSTALESYSTKIDLWIEAYRENAILGKLDDGTTTMTVGYEIPMTAVKAQLKQLLMDLLQDQTLLPILKQMLPDDEVQRLLDTQMQAYYFYTIDELPLNGNLTISRTVSMEGETVALSMALPFYDSQGGSMTISYSRQKGEGDLPEENTIELRSEKLLLKVDYQTYSTMTGTTVYQGTLLRQPLGVEAYAVEEDGAASQSTKTLSAAFTLSSQETTGTDDEGKDMQTQLIELNVQPEYTPDTEGDDATIPTEEQKTSFVEFEPLSLKWDTKYVSGQAKSASTTFEATLTVSGERMPQTLTFHLEGRTRAQWVPDAIQTDNATVINTMEGSALQNAIAQAAIKGGMILFPYISMPVPSATPQQTAEATAAP